MDADGQVEPEAEPVAVQSLPQVVELPAHQRLRHEVEALLAGIDVLGLQRSGARRRRPVPPVPSQPGLRATEARVADQFLVQQRRVGSRVPRQRRPHLGIGPGSRPASSGGSDGRWASPRSRISSDQKRRLTGEYGLGSGGAELKVGSSGRAVTRSPPPSRTQPHSDSRSRRSPSERLRAERSAASCVPTPQLRCDPGRRHACTGAEMTVQVSCRPEDSSVRR